MEFHIEILEVLERTVRLLLGNILTSLEPANDISHFDRKVLRREQGVPCENFLCPSSIGARVYQRCHHNGRIDDDVQRRSASRFFRISSAETRLWAALLRLRTCCNQASIDGRATIRRSSPCRNSCMDLPCSAARAANSSRTLSGTSRIVI